MFLPKTPCAQCMQLCNHAAVSTLPLRKLRLKASSSSAPKVLSSVYTTFLMPEAAMYLRQLLHGLEKPEEPSLRTRATYKVTPAVLFSCLIAATSACSLHGISSIHCLPGAVFLFTPIDRILPPLTQAAACFW